MHRDDLSEELRLRIWKVSDRAIHLYAQGVLSVQLLSQQLADEWRVIKQRGEPDTEPSQSLLTRIALRICSRELFYAWHSQDATLRNSAFAILRRYLHNSLRQARFATILQDFGDASEDILHQTLETLQRELLRGERAGPDDPAAFLKWTQTILIRNARAFIHHNRSDTLVSLDVHAELFAEQFVDKGNNDPLQLVLLEELQQTLKRAITTMRNQRYQQILIYTYLVGIDDEELASRLQIRAQDIYLWRHRALKKLRDNPEVMRVLRSLLE